MTTKLLNLDQATYIKSCKKYNLAIKKINQKNLNSK